MLYILSSSQLNVAIYIWPTRESDSEMTVGSLFLAVNLQYL